MKRKGQVKFVQKDKSVFFNTLKERVDNYFESNKISKNANLAMVIKSIVMLGIYIGPFVVLLAFTPPLGISLLLWSIMGVGLAGVGMSVMHDANHGAYSSNNKINFLMGSILNLLGASTFNWKLQHNILHHTYTNITHMDDDISDKPMLRFTPHAAVKSFHKYQWVYAFLFYGITTMYWILLKDFVQFSRYKKQGVNNNSKSQNNIALLKIVIVKVVYTFVILVAPTLIFSIPLGQVFAGFFLMHFIAGIILTVTFQLAHTVEGTSHPLPDENGIIDNNWAIHQMNTTVNFSRNNKLISWYVGGLNFQVEHHLFPKISHVHYPEIAHIVKKTAEEFNVPYLENKTFMQALRSHILTLQRFGRLPSLNEAIG
jgi:linoleoyl-CoA desaturase